MLSDVYSTELNLTQSPIRYNLCEVNPLSIDRILLVVFLIFYNIPLKLLLQH